MSILALISSLLIAQTDQCPGLMPNTDIPEIHKISERILGNDYPIMFIIYGKTQPSEDYPVIVFCRGSDSSTIEDNPSYERIETSNQDIEVYLKNK